VIVVLLIMAVAALGFVCAVAVLGIMFMRLPAADAHMANWRQVAKKFRADVSSRGWWRSSPALTFVYREARVNVVVKPARGVEWTRFALRHSSLALPVTLGSSDLVNELDGREEAVSFPLIADLRNAGWTAWTLDAHGAQRLITSAMQAQFVQLHQAVWPYQVQFRASRGLLQIDVDHALVAYDALHQLIRTGLAIYDQFLLASADGIEFVEPEELQPLESVRCRVCGEPILHGLVACRACKTPHHLECWEYIGHCSTYACGETRYVMPQIDS